MYMHGHPEGRHLGTGIGGGGPLGLAGDFGLSPGGSNAVFELATRMHLQNANPHALAAAIAPTPKPTASMSASHAVSMSLDGPVPHGIAGTSPSLAGMHGSGSLHSQ